jgi:hypothetical protein
VKYRIFVILAAIGIAGCLKIAVKSPDGQSTATYTGTSIVGGEDVSCGTLGNVVSCSASGQNLAGLAQAIAPYLGGAAGVPLPPPQPSPTPTPVARTVQ